MHPFNGLQLDEWAKERYAFTLSAAQRELRVQAVSSRERSTLWQWLQARLSGWRQRPQAKVLYRVEP